MSSRKRRIAAEQSLYLIQEGKIEKPDVYGTRNKLVRKVLKNLDEANKLDEEGEEEEEEEDFELDSDAIAAAEYLIKINSKSNIPACFVHQIHSILGNNTVADRELQEAIKEKGTWRKFHIIGSLEDEYVIIKTENYVKMIEEAKRNTIVEEVDSKVFDVFESIVKGSKYHEASISKEVLTKEFKLNEKQLTQLVSSGFILPHNIKTTLYWFSAPKQGTFMRNITGGRMEIQRIIKKRNSKDIMETMLKQKKLHKTVFDFDFLMHDLIGSGRVEKYSTTMGVLIRLTSKGIK